MSSPDLCPASSPVTDNKGKSWSMEKQTMNNRTSNNATVSYFHIYSAHMWNGVEAIAGARQQRRRTRHTKKLFTTFNLGWYVFKWRSVQQCRCCCCFFISETDTFLFNPLQQPPMLLVFCCCFFFGSVVPCAITSCYELFSGAQRTFSFKRSAYQYRISFGAAHNGFCCRWQCLCISSDNRSNSRGGSSGVRWSLFFHIQLLGTYCCSGECGCSKVMVL